MGVEPDNWLTPEQALTRFKRPDAPIFEFDLSTRTQLNARFGFTLGNIGILVPEGSLSEVVRSFSVFPVPNTRIWMRGLANLRGNLVPVYDLALMLGLSDTPMKPENLLVLEKGIRSIGVLVDNLPRSRDLSKWHPLKHMPKLPSNINEFVKELYSVDEMIWMSFDHVGFFESIKEKVAC